MRRRLPPFHSGRTGEQKERPLERALNPDTWFDTWSTDTAATGEPPFGVDKVPRANQPLLAPVRMADPPLTSQYSHPTQQAAS